MSAVQPVKVLTSRTAVLPANDVDTDQIIPARFLTTTTRAGLGRHLFHDWRYDAQGSPRPDFVLNTPAAAGCEVLVAGRNFGCGSSREHAAWALADHGFRAVISSEIADIFRSNALKNGLLPVVVDDAHHRWLLENPGVTVTIDVAASELRLPDGTAVPYPIDAFSRYCLLEGVDQLGFLRGHEDAIRRYEEGQSWMP